MLPLVIALLLVGIYGESTIPGFHDPRYRIDFHSLEKPYYPEDPDVEMVPMTNKVGARFECYLPKKTEEATSKDSNSSISLAVDVEEDDSQKSPEELLDILKGTCFHRNEGWWTYEFCYPPPGYLRQIHIENKKEIQEFSMGNYDPEATARLHQASPIHVQKDPRSQTAEQKYYAFAYTNGTKCDLTGEPRETEVRFVCSDSGVVLFGSIKEAPSCKYTMIFEAPVLCRHPMFQEEQQPWLVMNCNALETEEGSSLSTELLSATTDAVETGNLLVPVVISSERSEDSS